MKSQHDVAFIPGVGHLDYYCGASESVFQIAKNMETKPLVITEGPFGLFEKLQAAEIPCSQLPSPTPLLSGIRSASLFKKVGFVFRWLTYSILLWRLLRRHKVKTVYTANVVSMLAPYGVKLAGAKLVTGVRGEPEDPNKWSRTFMRSDRIAVLSHDMRNQILSKIDPAVAEKIKPKFEVIYNGIDFQAPASQQPKKILSNLRIGEEAVVVLYVAAFREWKGQLPFIQEVLPQVDALTDQSVDWHVVFLGSATETKDREYEQLCQQTAREQAFAKRLHFVGFQDDIWSWYEACDLVALGSRFEGMPRCVIEAMAARRPAVSYDVCSVDELLSESESGIVVKQGQTTEMAKAIHQMLVQPELRHRCGENARKFAESNLDISAIAKRYEAMFASLGNGSR